MVVRDIMLGWLAIVFAKVFNFFPNNASFNSLSLHLISEKNYSCLKWPSLFTLLLIDQMKHWFSVSEETWRRMNLNQTVGRISFIIFHIKSLSHRTLDIILKAAEQNKIKLSAFWMFIRKIKHQKNYLNFAVWSKLTDMLIYINPTPYPRQLE